LEVQWKKVVITAWRGTWSILHTGVLLIKTPLFSGGA
jgi:hypothetical protein